MNCPNCARENPANAKFCIYCAANLMPETPVVVEATPAVGPTVRLEPAPTPSYNLPIEPQPAAAAPQSAPSSTPKKHGYSDGSIGAIFMIGLGVLFLTGNFFPGILVVLGITGYMSQARHGKSQQALQTLVFFAGLALLFATGSFFPGILFLLGAMYFLGRGQHGRGWC